MNPVEEGLGPIKGELGSFSRGVGTTLHMVEQFASGLGLIERKMSPIAKSVDFAAGGGSN